MGSAQGERVGHPHREAEYTYSSHRVQYLKSETVHAPWPRLMGSYCIYRMNKNSLSAVGEYKEISKVHEQLDNLTLSVYISWQLLCLTCRYSEKN